MSKDNLLKYLESRSEWFSVQADASSAEAAVMKHLQQRIIQKLYRFRLMQRALGVVCMLALVMGGGLLYHTLKPMQYVIHYPASGKEKSVVVEGNFQNSARRERVKMELDGKSNLWKATVKSRNVNLVDYTIYVVDNTEEPTPVPEED